MDYVLGTGSRGAHDTWGHVRDISISGHAGNEAVRNDTEMSWKCHYVAGHMPSLEQRHGHLASKYRNTQDTYRLNSTYHQQDHVFVRPRRRQEGIGLSGENRCAVIWLNKYIKVHTI